MLAIAGVAMTINRTKLAYILAPAFPTLYMLVMPYISGSAYTGRHDILLVLLFSLPISYLSCLLFGFPLIAFLRRKDFLNLINVVACGAVMGMLIYCLFGYGFSAFLDSYVSNVSLVKVLLWGAILGVMVALPFSLIAGIPLINQRKEKGVGAN